MTYTDTETARADLLSALPAIHAAALNTSVMRSDHVTGLRILLIESQGGTCAGCGMPFTGTVEVCHVNPSSVERTGYEIAPGNVYAGCKPCNTYDRNKTGSEIVASMVRPDLVQRAHPSRSACLSAWEAASVKRVASIRDAVVAG